MCVLEELTEKNQRRVEKLEHVCSKREEEHKNRIKDLESTYTVRYNFFEDGFFLFILFILYTRIF